MSTETVKLLQGLGCCVWYPQGAHLSLPVPSALRNVHSICQDSGRRVGMPAPRLPRWANASPQISGEPRGGLLRQPEVGQGCWEAFLNEFDLKGIMWPGGNECQPAAPALSFRAWD